LRWSEPAIACAETFADQVATIDEWCWFLDRIEAALTGVRRDAPSVTRQSATIPLR
jgi:hypothetical protein